MGLLGMAGMTKTASQNSKTPETTKQNFSLLNNRSHSKQNSKI